MKWSAEKERGDPVLHEQMGGPDGIAHWDEGEGFDWEIVGPVEGPEGKVRIFKFLLNEERYHKDVYPNELKAKVVEDADD